MAGSEQKSRLPIRKEIVESLRNPAALVSLGDLAVNHVINNPYKYEPKWFERLGIAVGALKDAIESKTRINGAAAELALLLMQPKEVPRYISRAEMDEIIEPTEEEIEAWAWGTDFAKTAKWFVAFVLFGILALLIFAVVTFGLESPDSTTTKVFLSLGGVILAVATSVLGVRIPVKSAACSG